jgi:hypothetical protein
MPCLTGRSNFSPGGRPDGAFSNPSRKHAHVGGGMSGKGSGCVSEACRYSSTSARGANGPTAHFHGSQSRRAVRGTSDADTVCACPAP